MMTDKVPTLEELLEKAKALPDSKYPNWIFQVTFHQFEDFPEYWTDFDMSDPRVEVLQTLPKIKDVNRYLELHRMWEDYVADVAYKYGVDPYLVPDMFRVGLIREYIPDEPRLSKKTKETKKFLKHGIIPQQTIDNGEVIHGFVEMNANNEIDTSYGEVIREPTEEEENLLGQGTFEIASQKRMDEFKNSGIAHDRRIEFVGDYYRAFNAGVYDSGPAVDADGMIDIDKLLKDEEEKERKPEWMRESDEFMNSLKGSKFIGGRFVDTKLSVDRQILAAFMAAGYNPNLLHESGMMSKKQVFLMGAQAGLDMDQFDNPKKWEKKKRKREKKMLKQHQRKLGSMASLLTANGFSDGYGNMDDPISIGIDDEDLFKL